MLVAGLLFTALTTGGSSWFGLSLGNSLPFGECAAESYDTPCIQDLGGQGRTGGYFEISGFRLPEVFEDKFIRVVMTEGKLQGIFIITRGVRVQDAVYELVSSHAGPSVEKALVKGLFAVESNENVVVAKWRFENLLIDLVGAFGSVETGTLWIRTVKGDMFEMTEFLKSKQRAGPSS